MIGIPVIPITRTIRARHSMHYTSADSGAVAWMAARAPHTVFGWQPGFDVWAFCRLRKMFLSY